MAQALTGPLRDLKQCLREWVHLARLLARDHDVRIEYCAPLVEDIATWDSATRTCRISEDAELRQQVWALQELWRYFTFGSDASSAHREPLLRVVPAQRRGYDPSIDCVPGSA